MASFMTMGGAGSTPKVIYGAKNGLLGMNSQANYTQGTVTNVCQVSAPALYLCAYTNLKNLKTLNEIICNGSIIATKTIIPDTNSHPIISLVLASFSNNGRFGASVSGGSNYSVSNASVCFIANGEPDVSFQQLFNNDELELDWDNIVTYEEASAIAEKTIDLEAGLYNIIFVTGGNNSGTHTHTITITNGTFISDKNADIYAGGTTVCIVNAEEGCTMTFKGNTNGQGSPYKAIIVVPYKE